MREQHNSALLPQPLGRKNSRKFIFRTIPEEVLSDFLLFFGIGRVTPSNGWLTATAHGQEREGKFCIDSCGRIVFVSPMLSYVKMSWAQRRRGTVMEAGLCICPPQEADAAEGPREWRLYDEAAEFMGKNATRRILRLPLLSILSFTIEGKVSSSTLQSSCISGWSSVYRQGWEGKPRLQSGGLIFMPPESSGYDEVAMCWHLDCDSGDATCMVNARRRQALVDLLSSGSVAATKAPRERQSVPQTESERKVRVTDCDALLAFLREHAVAQPERLVFQDAYFDDCKYALTSRLVVAVEEEGQVSAILS